MTDARPGASRVAERLTVSEVASLADVVVCATKDGGVLGFIGGESVETQVTFWFEKDGPPGVIRTVQLTLRRHPKETR